MNIFTITHNDRTIPSLPTYDGYVRTYIRTLYLETHEKYVICLSADAKNYFNTFRPDTGEHQRGKHLEDSYLTLPSGNNKCRILFTTEDKERGYIGNPDLVRYLEVYRVTGVEFVSVEWKAEIVVFGVFKGKSCPQIHQYMQEQTDSWPTILPIHVPPPLPTQAEQLASMQETLRDLDGRVDENYEELLEHVEGVRNSHASDYEHQTKYNEERFEFYGGLHTKHGQRLDQLETKVAQLETANAQLTTSLVKIHQFKLQLLWVIKIILFLVFIWWLF